MEVAKDNVQELVHVLVLVVVIMAAKDIIKR